MLQRTLSVGLALFFLLCVVSAATAQDATPYKSNKGYAVQPPSGWEWVTGELEPAELERLPQTIREHYDPNTTDAMFMDLSGKDDAFKDNLNVVVLDDVIPLSPELVEELQRILTQQYESMFESFNLEAFEMAQYGPHSAVKILATYKLLDYELVLFQALMSGPKNSLVLTCTMEKSRRDDRINTCGQAFGSVKFD